jgi:hypothetical protein
MCWVSQCHISLCHLPYRLAIYGGIFNIFEWIFSLGFVNDEHIEKDMDRPSMAHTKGFFHQLDAAPIGIEAGYHGHLFQGQ